MHNGPTNANANANVQGDLRISFCVGLSLANLSTLAFHQLCMLSSYIVGELGSYGLNSSLCCHKLNGDWRTNPAGG